MHRRRHQALAVACESIEPRQLMTLATVTATNQADDIRMTVTTSTILVDVNGFTNSYPRGFGGFDSVSITASGGADHIYIDSNESVPVTVNAGSGDDEIHIAQASQLIEDVSAAVSVTSASGNDVLFFHDDADTFGDTYTINNGKVTGAGSGGVSYSGMSSIRIASGAGADTFDALNTSGANLIVDGQADADILKINRLGTGAATVSIDANQDFASIESAPGGNLNLLNNAGLLLTTNGSNVEGNVTLGTGYIIERNSQTAGGLGYWRGRIVNGKNGTSPSLTSPFATASAIGDGIGYAYAQNTALTSFGGVTLNSGDLVVRYTLNGDANLSGNVNFDDLVALAQNYNGTGKLWTTGDFTLDGTTNFDDLVPLAQNYNASVVVPTILATRAVAAPLVTKKSTPARNVAATIIV